MVAEQERREKVINDLKEKSVKREKAIKDLYRDNHVLKNLYKNQMRDLADLHTRYCEAIGEIPCLKMHSSFGTPFQMNQTNHRKRKNDIDVKDDRKRRRVTFEIDQDPSSTK